MSTTPLPLLLLACLLACTACAQPDAHVPASRDDASLSGTIQHPAHAVPAMRICAVAEAPARPVCIAHRAGQDHYTLSGLAPGVYQVIAQADDGMFPVGGHVHAVQCIRAPCPEMLQEVTLAAGEHRDGIDLNGFYPERADFPAMP